MRVMSSHDVVREDFPEEVTSEIINPRKLNLQKRKVKFEGQTLNTLYMHKSLGTYRMGKNIGKTHI